MKNDRKAYYAWELPEEVVKAIAESKMDSKHDELNELLNKENKMQEGDSGSYG